MKIDLEKFWRGCGARWISPHKNCVQGSKLENVWKFSDGSYYEELPDPHNSDDFQFEDLLDVLERLSVTGVRFYLDWMSCGKREYVIRDCYDYPIANHPDRRTAVILAICKLLDSKVEAAKRPRTL